MSLSTALIERVLLEGAFAPVNITGAGADGDWVSMKDARKLLAILLVGAWAGGTSAITLEQASDNAGTGAKALAFTRYWTKATFSGASVWAEQTATANTFNLSAASKIVAIEIDATELDVANGFTYVRVRSATPGANTDLLAALYILGDLRYAGDATTLVDPKA